MPKDVEYIWGLEDVLDILKTMDTYFNSTYKLGKDWLVSHPWTTAEDEDRRRAAFAILRLTARVDQSRELVSSDILTLEKIIEKIKSDNGLIASEYTRLTSFPITTQKQVVEFLIFCGKEGKEKEIQIDDDYRAFWKSGRYTNCLAGYTLR